jgi:hypothetical protein
MAVRGASRVSPTRPSQQLLSEVLSSQNLPPVLHHMLAGGSSFPCASYGPCSVGEHPAERIRGTSTAQVLESRAPGHLSARHDNADRCALA